MTVIVKSKSEQQYSISARDIREGCAYIDADGDIYIGNSVAVSNGTIMAFSIKGDLLIYEDSYDMLREVTLTYTVS